MEKKDSNRRDFFSKIAKLGLAGSIGALMLGRVGEKTLVPSVHAADIVIDVINTGTSFTLLKAGSSSTYAFGGWNESTSGSGANGIFGRSDSTEGRGVEGFANASTGDTAGIKGRSSSTSGKGVEGLATANSGVNRGVYGTSQSTSGNGVEGFASASTGTTRGVFGQSNSTSGISVEGYAGVAGAKAMVARGFVGQTANLQEWQNVARTPLSVVDKDGKLGIGTIDPGPMLDIVSGTTGPLNAASAPPGSAPNSFIAENLTSGNHKSQFTFRSNGANKWSFGNDVNGNGGQNFFFYDEVASTTPLRIDSSGVVHGNFQASDLSFANGVRATEEGDGLAFKNPKGEKIAVLDSEGNLQVKGKITENPNL